MVVLHDGKSVTMVTSWDVECHCDDPLCKSVAMVTTWIIGCHGDIIQLSNDGEKRKGLFTFEFPLPQSSKWDSQYLKTEWGSLNVITYSHQDLCTIKWKLMITDLDEPLKDKGCVVCCRWVRLCHHERWDVIICDTLSNSATQVSTLNIHCCYPTNLSARRSRQCYWSCVQLKRCYKFCLLPAIVMLVAVAIVTMSHIEVKWLLSHQDLHAVIFAKSKQKRVTKNVLRETTYYWILSCGCVKLYLSLFNSK